MEDTWDLSALYVSKEAWEKDLAEIGSVTKQIAGMQGRVTSSAAELLSVLEPVSYTHLTLPTICSV